MKRQAREQVSIGMDKTLSSEALRNAQGGGLCCENCGSGPGSCGGGNDDNNDGGGSSDNSGAMS